MKILVPTDFSGAGDVACRFATNMAVSHYSEVLVMKTSDVLSSSEIVSGRNSLQSSYLQKTIGEDYRICCEQLFNDQGNHKKPLNLMIERGPITVIAPVQQLIREQQIDLVVSGVSGIANDEFIGVDAAVQSSPSAAPVLTLKKGENVDSIRSIVLPISMATRQTDFVLRARSLQEMCAAHLHLLFVKSESFNPSDIHAEHFVDAFARHYQIRNYTATVRTDGDQTGCIIEYALEVNADAILWGMKGS